MALPAPDAQPMVLVVDDEPMMRALMTQALRDCFHVLAASDGRQALDLVWGLGGDIRVVVTDIQMPKLDGLALADQLARLDRPPAVLLISAYGTGIELPAAYLPKPFTPDALVNAVTRLLGRTHLRAGGVH